jgi:hypothetical protein
LIRENLPLSPFKPFLTVLTKGICLICIILGEKTSSEVECYHPDKKTWYAINDMNIGRSAVSACAVTDIYNARDFSYHGNAIECIAQKLKSPTKAEMNVEYAHHLARWRKSPKERMSNSDNSFETMI